MWIVSAFGLLDTSAARSRLLGHVLIKITAPRVPNGREKSIIPLFYESQKCKNTS